MNKSDNTINNPLSQDFDLLSLLKFALPTIITMLFMGLYTIVDTIFISKFINTNALSSINILCPVINIIVGISTMIATGGSAIIARKIGSGEIERANQDFTLIVIFTVIISFILGIIGINFIDTIIWKLGCSKLLFPYCKDYLFIILIFTPANMLQVLFQNLIVTAGKPTLGLILSISSGIINIIFDYIFIVSFNMGITGAALGTSVGYIIATLVGIVFFTITKTTLSFTKPVIDISILVESCANGSSEMVSQISTAITTFFFNQTMMNLLGEKGVASITIIIYSQFLMTTIYIGFCMGVAPIISFNYGLKNKLRLKKIYKNCFKFIITSSIIIFLITIIGNNLLVSLFTSPSTEVFKITTSGFKIFAFSFLFSGINIFSSATFTALSNGKISATISFLRTFGFIMIGLWIFPQFMKITGVWFAVPFAEFITFIISIFFIIKENILIKSVR